MVRIIRKTGFTLFMFCRILVAWDLNTRSAATSFTFSRTRIVDWIDVFTRRELADIIVDSLNYCIEKKGLEVYVWCLMPSHLLFFPMSIL